MNNITCLYLPQWSIQRLRHNQPELKRTPILFYEVDSRRGDIVSLASTRLQAIGIQPGLPLTEAKVLLGSRKAKLVLRNYFDDEKVLRQLAVDCQQFSPVVGIEPAEHADSLLFDLRGCLHLYGDERAFCRQLLEFMIERGFFGKVAVADTVGRAWAIAHFGVRRLNRYRLAIKDDFHKLPVAGLRLPPSMIAKLHEFDLRQIGQLLRLPRETLKPRFGAQLPERIDLLTGQRPELIVSESLPEPVIEQEDLEYPIGEPRLIEIVIERLLRLLLHRLEKPQHGLLRLLIRMQHLEQPDGEILVGVVRPTVDADNVLKLIRLKLERYLLPDKVRLIHLEAVQTAPLRYRRQTLFEEQSQCERRELEMLINQLKTRLGDQTVLQAELRDDFQPERSVVYYSALEPRGASAMLDSRRTIRPLTLFPQPIAVRVNSVVPQGPPLRFWWDRQEHIADISWGPERIETGWWRDEPIRRDYYRVETTRQQRFWLFRRRDQRDWFLHGCFD